MSPELDLLSEDGVASLTVFEALVGEVRFVLCGEFCCEDEEGVVGHSMRRAMQAFILITLMPAVTDLCGKVIDPALSALFLPGG